MSDLKNKDLGIFQVFSYTLFIFLSGIICSFTSTGQTTVTFSTVGAVDWTVPDDVYSITIHCWGGGGAGGGVAIGANITQGAAGGGGKGGMYSVTSLSVTPGQVLRVNVGAGGTGTTSAGNAGGPSWVSTTGSTPWPTATNGAWASGGSGGSGATTNVGSGATGYSAPGTGSGTVQDGGNGAIGRRLASGNQAGGGGGGGGGTTEVGVAATPAPINGAGSPTSASAGGAGGNADGGAGGAGGFGNSNNATTIGTVGAVRGGGGGGTRGKNNNSSARSGSGGAGGRGEVRIVYTIDPLPIVLSSFSANCKGNSAHVSWTTVSEQNSDYFTVEHSRDGEQWSEVESVIGAGTTNSTRYYSVLDDVAANYYRLTQTDFDGKMTMYPIVFVDCNAKKSENGLVVYPNPSNDGSFTVTVNSQEDLGESTVFIHTINGQLVASYDLNVLSGTNIVQFTDMKSGTYLISVNGNGKKAFKPVKLVVR